MQFVHYELYLSYNLAFLWWWKSMLLEMLFLFRKIERRSWNACIESEWEWATVTFLSAAKMHILECIDHDFESRPGWKILKHWHGVGWRVDYCNFFFNTASMNVLECRPWFRVEAKMKILKSRHGAWRTVCWTECPVGKLMKQASE